jgi:hypothetical protein
VKDRQHDLSRIHRDVTVIEADRQLEQGAGVALFFEYLEECDRLGIRLDGLVGPIVGTRNAESGCPEHVETGDDHEVDGSDDHELGRRGVVQAVADHEPDREGEGAEERGNEGMKAGSHLERDRGREPERVAPAPACEEALAEPQTESRPCRLPDTRMGDVPDVTGVERKEQARDDARCRHSGPRGHEQVHRERRDQGERDDREVEGKDRAARGVPRGDGQGSHRDHQNSEGERLLRRGAVLGIEDAMRRRR